MHSGSKAFRRSSAVSLYSVPSLLEKCPAAGGDRFQVGKSLSPVSSVSAASPVPPASGAPPRPLPPHSEPVSLLAGYQHPLKHSPGPWSEPALHLCAWLLLPLSRTLIGFLFLAGRPPAILSPAALVREDPITDGFDPFSSSGYGLPLPSSWPGQGAEGSVSQEPGELTEHQITC